MWAIRTLPYESAEFEVKMILIQLVLFCALFTLMVKVGVGNNALNGLYFYPKPVQEKVYELGLTDREQDLHQDSGRARL